MFYRDQRPQNDLGRSWYAYTTRETTFSMGGNNFYFFTHHKLGFISNFHETYKFFGYLEISILNPQIKYFHENENF